MWGALRATGPRSRGPADDPLPALREFDRTNLRGLTLGIYQPWFSHASPAVVAACKALLDGLRDLGARVREITIPELEVARVAHVVTIFSEMATAMDRYRRAQRRDLAYATRVSLAMGRACTARDYLQAQRVRPG